MNVRYRELIIAIEEAETICSLVDEVGQDISENNIAHKHIYGMLCDRAADKVTALIGAALRYNKELETCNNENQSTTPTG